MAKLIKGNSVQNIITDGDVLVTSPSKIGKTLDEVLDEQQSDIDKLKSNVKYIYAYGGVGGSGSGGGTGSGEKPISVLMTLNGVAINNGGSAIILDGKGKYKLYIKISNAGGRNLFMGYTTNGSTVTDELMFYTLNGDNKYKREIDVELNGNGKLNIAISDDEGNNIGYYSQDYIVESDMFNVTLNYIDNSGEVKQYSDEPYECFVDDPNRLNRYFNIDYSIYLLNYSEVNITCEIDGVGTIYTGTESAQIPIEGDECGVLIDGEPILQNKFMGIYTLKAKLSYKIEGKEVVRTRSLLFSVVPSGLYINVRTSGDVLYDSLDLLLNDIKNGENGIPYKSISQGSSLMMYCKVFEGSIGSKANTYPTTFTAYDRVIENGDSDVSETVDWGWVPLNIMESETLTEQVESYNGVSVTFPTGGIKKIEIKTKGAKGEEYGIEKVFEKYVFVKPFESSCDWYDGGENGRFNNVIDSYFRANQGSDTYNLFPQLSSGDGVLSLSTLSTPIEISQSNWYEGISGKLCTVITFGIQVSNINSENAKIVDIYSRSSSTEPEYCLRTTRLFTDIDSNINKIAIPTSSLNKNENSQYHLIQIIRHLSDDKNAVYEDSLYIDGVVESVDRITYSSPNVISKLILNNINICYNLINVQYFASTTKVGEEIINFNPDAYAYQYWLSYKEKYVNSGSDVRLKDSELFIMQNMDRIYFDGTNVVVDDGVVLDIAGRSEIPTVVFSYDCASDGVGSIDEFMELMWQGRANGDKTFNGRKIDLYWIPEKSGGVISDYKVNIPQTLTDNTNGYTINGSWELNLQGTSTMRNRIKNYSLKINTGGSSDKILFSPNFDITNNKTFLPDLEWTIKADIADSAHANNTSIGKFVNTVCTKIDTNIPDGRREATDFIKNTLEGIPVLLYFMCTGNDGNGNISKKVYYFGIYNFNLGRNSYYNLGYTGGVDAQSGKSDFMKVFDNIKTPDGTKYFKDKIFTFAVGEGRLSPNIAIGEIQDNYPDFDFHQYNETLLFKKTNRDNACMFGDESKITASNIADAQKALSLLVRSVAKAGKFCFEQVGRKDDFVTSRYFEEDENGNPVLGSDGKPIYGKSTVNRYNKGKIPDPKLQKSYSDEIFEDGSNIKWEESTLCDNVSDEDLKNLITTYDIEGEPNKPILNYTSAAEYYTICMAFGMVDSVLKNMNLKNFRSESEGYQFNCAFYDMDCALEEANDGQEKISYLAATDFWYSEVLDEKTNKIGQIKKRNDYWGIDAINTAGEGFDFTSSYLFAVIKYAKSIFDSYPAGVDKYEENLKHYPQNFWALLRNSNGELRSADYFIDNYFKSGISSTFEYLASLNYRVKYLYHGKSFDSENNYTDKYLANCEAFNGSRRVKVKNWLSKRLRFMDLMMNVNDLKVPISSGINLNVPGPGEEFKSSLSSNNDIVILHSAFDSNEKNTALTELNGDVKIYAPKYTPFIFTSGTAGGTTEMYLLPGGVDKPNVITINTQKDVGTHFYGSGMFTSVDKIEYMFTGYRSIISDNIEKIIYGGTNISANTGEFNINAKSATEINMNIPNMGGKLIIDANCISLSKINIANSGFSGEFKTFPNLQEVNISGVNATEIYVSGSNYLTGEKFHISGSSEDKKTTLTVLNISDVTGNFICDNTHIEQIVIQNTTPRDVPGFNSDMLSEFTIYGDSRLKSLKLNGFRKVSITACNNLEELSIDDALEELYINLEKIDKDGDESKLKTIFLNKKKEDIGDSDDVDDTNENVDRTGIFDFTNYPNLKRVTLKNCYHLVHVKLPDHDIETDGMNDNPNLQWIDTGILPSFKDVDNDINEDGFIEGVGDYIGYKFPIYSNGHKLILCSDSAFYNCPKYAMLRSDWDKGQEMIGNENYIAYTNITVSDKCTSLSNTFCINRPSVDDKFNMKSAIRFIEKCIPNTVQKNITSLSGCFKGRKNVSYVKKDAQDERGYDEETYKSSHKHPMLENFKSLIDISEMYANTGVEFVSKFLLDLPNENNTSADEHMLSWDSFVQPMTKLNITNDALYNISYRIRSYSFINFTIYEYNNESKQYETVGKNADNPFRICDFFYPFEEGKTYTNDGCEFDESVEPYNFITSIESFNFADQFIDFRGLFKLFPNVTTISSSFNGNLINYNLEGLLQPCKKITTIIQSFCDSGINNIETSQEIDLFNFFNWENNTDKVVKLFEGTKDFSNGFTIRKRISYSNLVTVLNVISNYTELTNLTNIFSYCTITDYNNEEIKFNKTLGNILNISNLFNSCTSTYAPFTDSDAENKEKGIYTGGVINIGRSFFKCFPNFVAAQRTLANTHLSSPLTYDYFCRRSEGFEETDIYLSEDLTNTAKLKEYTYNSNIIYLTECFYNTKFVNCKNWFDQNDNQNIINKEEERNCIIISENNTISDSGVVYYTYSKSSGFKRHTLDNDILDDCLDNYTDFVLQNSISTGSEPYVWYNHDLKQDLDYYGNISIDSRPFEPKNNENSIQETYCCLPPDILYGCATTAEIDGIFANTNIVGVIPRNLTKNIKSKSIPNIFRNVNIMPNLEYYYDIEGGLNASILDKVTETVDVDGGIGEEYCVVFRDEYGKLKKRKPVGGDRSLGQFVYVPVNFTESGNIMNTFNFRYNLPKHWGMPSKFIDDEGLVVESYKSTYELESAISNKKFDVSKLPYHSQYYFTTDKSVKWSDIYDAKSVFINNSQDIDFSNKNTFGRSRQYYDENELMIVEKKNVWTNDKRVYIATDWTKNILNYFYVDLNLCGKKNENNMIVDNGCPIVIKNRQVHLDNFVSGILTIFLNGRVFDESFIVNNLSTSNHKYSSSTSIIDYHGFGKNMILPYFNGYLSDKELSFMPIDNDFIYYDFMVECHDTSMGYYYEYFGKDNLRNEYVFDSKYKKYVLK